MSEEKYKRPTWDEYFMEVARTIAKRATCDRGRSGCVIARDNQILVTGYVGSPAGLPHCDDVGHLMRKMIRGRYRFSALCSHSSCGTKCDLSGGKARHFHRRRNRLLQNDSVPHLRHAPNQLRPKARRLRKTLSRRRGLS